MRSMIILLLLSVRLAAAQTAPHEKIVYSFKTFDGQKLEVAMGPNDNYISCRFKGNEKTIFTYPAKDTSSWNKVTYSYYLRAGAGDDNLDLNYLSFTINNSEYIIYDNSAGNEEPTCGVRIIRPDQKMVEYEGDFKTKKGHLMDFRNNYKIAKSDKTFD